MTVPLARVSRDSRTADRSSTPLKQGERAQAESQAEMGPLREQMQTLFVQGSKLLSWSIQAFCNALSKREPALWTFTRNVRGEPATM